MTFHIVITAFVILALHVAMTWEGMILFRVCVYGRHLPAIIRKPLYECMACMSSIWGLLFFVFFFHYKVDLVLVPMILTLVGINILLELLLNILTNIYRLLKSL